MRRLDVERLLVKPATRVTRVLLIDGGRREVRELRGRERVIRVVDPEVRLRVRQERRRVVGVHDRHRDTASVLLVRRAHSVAGAQLRGLVAADVIRLRALERCVQGRIVDRVGLLTPERRARLRVAEPAGGAGSCPGCAALVLGAEAPLVSDVVAMFWLTPTTPETNPPRDEGIESGLFASRTFLPPTW